MATGGAGLLPTKEKTNYLRFAALVIDGGTLALKTQFDLQFPPQSLGQDLRTHGNFQILNNLKQRKILKHDQFDLLYPPPPKIVDSSDFDVSLLSCLIQNLPVFKQHTSPVWKQPGPPLPTDLSLAAEVKRLRLLRNQVRVHRRFYMSDLNLFNELGKRNKMHHLLFCNELINSMKRNILFIMPH